MASARPPLRLLLVEDNPADERLLRVLLKSESTGEAGLAVVTVARTLAQAMDAVADAPFDAILLDLDLPDSQGLETVRRMHETAAEVALVVLTGHDDPAQGVSAVVQGAQDALTKGRVDGAHLWRALGHAVERQRADAEIRRLNADLERRVSERTRELALANEQLEAFARSASHDLKAPLRSVEGMVTLLADEHSHNLDADALELLERVQRAVGRMDTLIDALLNLSLLGREALRPATLDLGRMARAVFHELLTDHPHRIVGFQSNEPLTVEADENLVFILLQNLIGNALKFTARAEEPRIDVGRMAEERPPVFYVRDNGAGFDMQFADKLFRPFQRLHSSDEFAGTGIGLATAHRIVHIHGGEIWAEGEVGRGACIFFTLAPRPAP